MLWVSSLLTPPLSAVWEMPPSAPLLMSTNVPPVEVVGGALALGGLAAGQGDVPQVEHGQRVGLCVEHPAVQRQQVITGEEQVQVPGAGGRGGREAGGEGEEGRGGEEGGGGREDEEEERRRGREGGGRGRGEDREGDERGRKAGEAGAYEESLPLTRVRGDIPPDLRVPFSSARSLRPLGSLVRKRLLKYTSVSASAPRTAALADRSRRRESIQYLNQGLRHAFDVRVLTSSVSHYRRGGGERGLGGGGRGAEAVYCQRRGAMPPAVSHVSK